jgi:hypothetical protein
VRELVEITGKKEVTMSDPVRAIAKPSKQSRPGPWWVAVPALLGAAAGLIVPGVTGSTSAGAAVLGVGALALLAGHTWGLMVVLAAHTTLVGRLWPSVAHVGVGVSGVGGAQGAASIAVVLVTALPSIALTAILLPEVARLLFPERSRKTHGLFVAGVTLMLAASLVLPALDSAV